MLLPAALLIGAITALLIYVDSPGSVFYRSTRVGRHGRSFEMLKFRSMVDGASAQVQDLTDRNDNDGVLFKMRDDPRVTRVGRFLRRYSLDELPQLWNVIKGEMRLVGPRPEVPEFVARYREEYEELLTVLPGITGPAAVEYASEPHLLGLQNDPRRFYEESLMPRKIAIDRAYVRTRTFSGDLRILAQTLLVPLSKVARRIRSDRRALRLEAGLLLGACAGLLLTFVLASSAGA